VKNSKEALLFQVAGSNVLNIIDVVVDQKTTTIFFRSSINMSSNGIEFECSNTNQFLNFANKNDELTWSVGNKNTNTRSPDVNNSIPWKLDATCNVTKNDKKCYEIEYDKKKVNVCVVGGPNSQMNRDGHNLLQQSTKMQWTKQVSSNDASFETKQKCHIQKFRQLDDTVIESWVDKDDEVTCENIIKDAKYGYSKQEVEADRIQKVFLSSNSQAYHCIIDSRKIANDNAKLDNEMKWVRASSYACKDKGWKCHDLELEHYNGGNRCEMDDDCHQNVEFGICKNNVCTVGSTIGSSCTTHEDCDVLQEYAKGTCKDNKCTTGKLNIDVSYMKPLNCPPPDGKTKYQYCGEINHGTESKFAGYCVDVKDKNANTVKSFKTCKPFLNDLERKTIAHEEKDFQRGDFTQSEINFPQSTPHWERLVLCPPEEVATIDGKTVCMATMENVSGNLLKNVIADNINDAHKLCQEEYPQLPVFARTKF
jgi:hypothetical protein